MKDLKVVSFAKNADATLIQKELEGDGYRIFSINSLGCDSYQEFYTEMLGVLPMGIPLPCNIHWDGFADSLYEGIADLNEKNIAIVWHNSQLIFDLSLEFSFYCLDTLISVSRIFANAREENEQVNMIVVVLGNGPRFEADSR